MDSSEIKSTVALRSKTRFLKLWSKLSMFFFFSKVFFMLNVVSSLSFVLPLMANFLDISVGNTNNGKRNKKNKVLDFFVQGHTSTARLLPRVFYQPCWSGSYLSTHLLFSCLGHLSRSSRTGLKLYHSTRSWESRCQPNWKNCIRAWVDCTGLEIQAQVRMSHLRQQRPLLTAPPWQTIVPSVHAHKVTFRLAS